MASVKPLVSPTTQRECLCARTSGVKDDLTHPSWLHKAVHQLLAGVALLAVTADELERRSAQLRRRDADVESTVDLCHTRCTPLGQHCAERGGARPMWGEHCVWPRSPP